MPASRFLPVLRGRSPWSVPIFMLLGLLLCLPAQAASIRPFAITNQGPLALPVGLPDTGDWRLTPARTTTVALAVDLANTYTEDLTAREELLLDGESWRTTLSLRLGLGSGGEIGLDLPYLGIGGGTFDGFIQGWHDFFNLPQGGRDHAAKGNLHYRYRRDGHTKLDVSRSGDGIGDLRLTGGWPLLQAETTSVALRGTLTLPTGSSNALVGSGAFSGALWLIAGNEHPVSLGRLAVWGALGGLLRERGDLVRDQQQKAVGFGSCGIGWAPAERIDFKLQLNGNTPLYTDSDLPPLSGYGAVLVIGGSLHLSPTTAFDIGVSEDLNVGSAADVALHVSVRSTF